MFRCILVPTKEVTISFRLGSKISLFDAIKGKFFGVWIPMGDGKTCLPVSETYTRLSGDRSTSTMRQIIA